MSTQLKLKYLQTPRIWAYRVLVLMILSLWFMAPVLAILKLMGALVLIYLGCKRPTTKPMIIEVHHNKLVLDMTPAKRLTIKPCMYICTPFFTWIQGNSKHFTKKRTYVFSVFCLQDSDISTLNREVRRICKNP